MKRSRFTEEQIIGILREQEAGAATAELCRKHAISSATFYEWKASAGEHRRKEATTHQKSQSPDRKLIVGASAVFALSHGRSHEPRSRGHGSP